METIHEIVRRAEQNYLLGTTKLGKYVSWSMHDTIETVDAYLNSQHTSGETDSLGREKPFFNIVTAATNIWWRATDIDRKDIRFIPQNASSVVLAFIANVLLQKWMDENDFGQFLNNWGRALARYGSAIPKFVVKNGKLTPSVVAWNRFIADPTSFDAIPHIEKFYMTLPQLRKMPEYDQNVIDNLVAAIANRRTLDRQTKDTQPTFIEVYEVHGLMDTRLMDDTPDVSLDLQDIRYSQQMHVVSYLQSGEGKGDYMDFTLYKGKESHDPYVITHLIEEDGRTLAIGAVEYLLDAQWMANHSVKNMKDTLDIASKLIFQTADANFASRNVLSAIETGDILIHQTGMPLERIGNDKPDIGAMQNYLAMWEAAAKDITGTPDAMRGQLGHSAAAYRLGALQVQQATSLFEVMTENKGLAIERMLREFVIPHLKKQLKNKDEVVAILDDAGIKQIDSYYIPRQAIKNFNDRTFNQIIDNASKIANGETAGDAPQPFNPQQEQANVQQQLGPLGNKRFFKPDDLGKKTWDDLLSDFEWDAIKVEVTNENGDTQAILQTLSTALQAIATNPAVLQDPNARLVFNKMLTESGIVSPLELSTAQSTPPPPPQMPPGMPGQPMQQSPMQQTPAPQAAPVRGG